MKNMQTHWKINEKERSTSWKWWKVHEEYEQRLENNVKSLTNNENIFKLLKITECRPDFFKEVSGQNK